jgi:hypothetical protein
MAKEQREYHEMGRYLAHVKHAFMIRRLGNEVFVKDIWFQYSHISSKITQIVVGIERTGELGELSAFIKEHRESTFVDMPDKYLLAWSNRMQKIVEDLMYLPNHFVKEQIESALIGTFEKAFDELSKRIGLDEFASIIGWEKKKLSVYRQREEVVPEPIEILAATPLWTVGQAQTFKRVIENREETGVKGDWTTPTVRDYDEKFLIEECEFDEGRYAFVNNAYLYYGGAMWDLSWGDMSANEIASIMDYFSKRVAFMPDFYSIAASHCYDLGEVERAKQYYEESVKQYHAVIPEDFEGCFDANDEVLYFEALLSLAWIYGKEGNVKKALEFVEIADRHSAGSFFEPDGDGNFDFEGYMNWYAQNYIPPFEPVNS